MNKRKLIDKNYLHQMIDAGRSTEAIFCAFRAFSESAILRAISQYKVAKDEQKRVEILNTSEFDIKTITTDFALMTSDDNIMNHYLQMINPKQSLIRPNF